MASPSKQIMSRSYDAANMSDCTGDQHLQLLSSTVSSTHFLAACRLCNACQALPTIAGADVAELLPLALQDQAHWVEQLREESSSASNVRKSCQEATSTIAAQAAKPHALTGTLLEACIRLAFVNAKVKIPRLTFAPVCHLHARAGTW